MSYALYFIAALEAVGGLFTVSRIGRPRKPLTPSDAVTVIVLDAMITVILVLAAMRLS
jgi:hypothetical protein